MRVRVAIAVACLSIAAVSVAADVGAAIRRTTNIPEQSLDAALQMLAKERQLQMIYAYETVGERRTGGAQGELTFDEAMATLLDGTGLTYRFLDENTVTIVPMATGPATKSRDPNRAPSKPAAGNLTMSSGVETSLSRESSAVPKSFWQRLRLAQADQSSNSTANSPADKSAQSEKLEEIVVTAQKRPERAIDLPISVAAISGAKLEEKGIKTISDLSYAVPSLSVRETGPGQQLITIRGIGNDRGTSSLVGMYLDEAPVSSIPFAQVDLRVNDIARVEVLRGPQGTLYGEGSVGGTIRFITNQPEFDRLTGSVSASISNTADANSLGSEVRGMVNVPLVENVLALRVAAVYENASGWIDQPAASRENINDYDLRNVRATAAWRPFEGLDVSLSSTIHRVDGGGQSLVNVLPADASQFIDPIHPTQATFLRDDYNIHSLAIHADLGFAELVSASSYMDKEAENTNVNIWQTAPASNPLSLISATPRYAARSFSQEVRLVSKGEAALSWTAGLFYRDTHDRTTQLLDYVLGGFPGFDFPVDAFNDSQSWAAFGDVGYAFTSRLKLGAGLRYFKDDRSFTDVVSSEKHDGSFDSVDPRIYATFALTDDVKLYVNAATGFRSGGFNPDFAIGLGGQPQFEPESLTSYESGLKSVLLDGKLRADISLFWSRYEDIQVLRGLGETANAGEAEIKGAELDLEWAPTDYLTLGVVANVIDNEITKITAQTHVPGDKLNLVPDYSYALSATRAFRLPSLNGRLAASVDYSVQGRATETNRSQNLLEPVVENDTLSFLNASLRLQRESWVFEVFGQNLLDERDLLAPSVFGFAGQARPRTFGLRMSYSP